MYVKINLVQFLYRVILEIYSFLLVIRNYEVVLYLNGNKLLPFKYDTTSQHVFPISTMDPGYFSIKMIYTIKIANLENFI